MTLEEALARLGNVRIEVLGVQPGGLSNRAWRVRCDGRDGVLRATQGERGTRIDVATEVRAMAAAGSLAPEVLAWADGVLVTAFVEASGPAPADALGTALARLHRLESPSLRVLELGPLLLGLPWTGALAGHRAEVEGLVARLEERAPCFSHHDVRQPNLRFTGERLVFVDWEYAALADPGFDLVCAVEAAGPEVERAYLEAGGPGRVTPEMEALRRLLDLHWYATHGDADGREPV